VELFEESGVSTSVPEASTTGAAAPPVVVRAGERPIVMLQPFGPVMFNVAADQQCPDTFPDTSTAWNIPVLPWGASLVMAVPMPPPVGRNESSMLQAPVMPVPGAGAVAADAGRVSATGALPRSMMSDVLAIQFFLIFVVLSLGKP